MKLCMSFTERSFCYIWTLIKLYYQFLFIFIAIAILPSPSQTSFFTYTLFSPALALSTFKWVKVSFRKLLHPKPLQKLHRPANESSMQQQQKSPNQLCELSVTAVEFSYYNPNPSHKTYRGFSRFRLSFCWLISISSTTLAGAGPADPPATFDGTAAIGLHISTHNFYLQRLI